MRTNFNVFKHDRYRKVQWLKGIASDSGFIGFVRLATGTQTQWTVDMSWPVIADILRSEGKSGWIGSKRVRARLEPYGIEFTS